MKHFCSIFVIVFVILSVQVASARDHRHHNHRHDRLVVTLAGAAIGTALGGMYYNNVQRPGVIYANDMRESRQMVERFHNHHQETLQNAFEAGRRDALKGRQHRGFKCCRQITDAYSQGYTSARGGMHHARW